MRPQESFIGQPVRSLQTMLRLLAEEDPQLLKVIPDGIFGSQTRNAVAAFQRSRGIPVTGVADQYTWERIVDAYSPAATRMLPAQPLLFILNPGQVLRRGDSHPYLYIVQSMLLTLSDIYGSMTAPVPTGILDMPTSESISDFQYLSALPRTGELDKVTWKHMALQYPLAVNLRFSQNRTKR